MIASAGLILARPFRADALPLMLLHQFGIRVAVGILLDTFVVRGLLAPGAVLLELVAWTHYGAAVRAESAGARPQPAHPQVRGRKPMTAWTHARMDDRMHATKELLGQRTSGRGSSSRRWPWWSGVIIYLTAQGASAGLSALATYLHSGKTPSLKRAYGGDTRWSDTLKRPIFQPPNWLFPIAWPINNIGAIYGALHVLNKPAGTPGREEYLALQAATGVDYALFSAGYFALRSTLNSLALTATYFALTVASLYVAIARLRDWRVALSLATTLAWLCVALPSAVAQALWNHDPFYNVGPFVNPSRTVLKK